MINRIICFIIIPSLFIAVFLKASGYNEVYMGPAMMNFLNGVDEKFISFRVEIPKIDLLPMSEINVWTDNLLNVMSSIANFFLTIINIIVTILNVVLRVVQWLVALIWCVIDLIADIKNTPVPEEPHWPFEDIEYSSILNVIC